MKKLLSILLALTMVMGTLVIIPFTASAETLDDHLITHWNFAGDNPWADKATNGTPDTMIPHGSASISNGTAYIPEYASSSAEHYIFADNSDDLMRTVEDRTIYIKFKSTKGNFANDGKDSDWVEIAGQNGALRTGISHDENKLFVSTNVTSMGENWAQTSGMTTFVANTWTTVAISYDKDISTGKIQILTCFKVGDGDWITGSVPQTDTSQTWVQDDIGNSTLYSLIFGRRYTSLGSPWSGSLTYDDIRIYDKALTADEVKSIVVTDEDPVVEPDEPEVPVNIEDYLLTHWDFAGDEPLADKATNGSVSDTMNLMNYATLQNDGTVYIPDNKNNTNNHYMYADDSVDLLRTTEDRTIYIVFKSQRDDATDNIIELVSQNGALRAGVNASKQFFNSTNSHNMTENGGVISADTATHSRDTWVTYSISYKKDISTGKINVLTCIKVGTGEWATVSSTYTDTAQTWTQDDSDAGKTDPMTLIFGRRAANNYGSTWGGNLTFEDIRIYGMALNAEQVASIEITNPAPTAPSVEMSGHSLSLAGDIGVNFFLTPNATAISSAKVTIKNGETVLLENAAFDDAHKNGENYKFTANVSAKETADQLTLTVTSGDTVLATDTYSVKDYGLYVIANAANYSTEIVDLVKALLTYGGCAQTYFNYNVENAYTADLTGLGTIIMNNDYNASITGEITGITDVAATLMLETKTEIVVALKIDGIALGSLDISGGTAEKKNGYAYITTGGICAQDLDAMQTITVTNKNNTNETITIQYSPMTFIQEMADNKGDTAIDTLVRAMYACWEAAEAYVATLTA